MKDPIKEINEKGYVHFKNVFTKEEIKEIHEAAQKYPEIREVLTHPELYKIFLHDKFIEVVKSLTGPTPVYAGDSLIAVNIKGGDGFHK